MDLKDPELLQFRGQDANECENFITAITKSAFAQGKQRDDQWTADFAATCMVNDALRWWNALDDEVQGSWKLLRRAMLLKYRPKFYRESGAEAEKFVSAVWDKAIDEGKHKDNEWIVTYASSCFAGDALRWYSSIDPDTQDDWKRLRQAILVQYPRDSLDGPSSKLVPTPAAALPISPAATASRRGRIRVSRSGISSSYYLSVKLLSTNRVGLTALIGDALEVEWNSGPAGSQMLSIPGSQLPGYDLLGAKYYAGDPHLPKNYLVICAVSSQTNSTAVEGTHGRLLTGGWQLSQTEGADRIFTVSVMDGEVKLHPRIGETGRNVWFAQKDQFTGGITEMSFELL